MFVHSLFRRVVMGGFVFGVLGLGSGVVWGQLRTQDDSQWNQEETTHPQTEPALEFEVKKPNTIRPVEAYAQQSQPAGPPPPATETTTQKNEQLIGALQTKLSELIEQIKTLRNEITETNQRLEAQEKAANIKSFSETIGVIAKTISEGATKVTSWAAGALKAASDAKKSKEAAEKASKEAAAKPENDPINSCSQPPNQIQTYLDQQYGLLCNSTSGSNSKLSAATQYKSEAEKVAKAANKSLGDARLAVGNSLDIDSVESNTTEADLKLLSAVERANDCVATAELGISGVDESFQVVGNAIQKKCKNTDETTNARTIQHNYRQSFNLCKNKLTELRDACATQSSGWGESLWTGTKWTLRVGAVVGVVGGAGYLIGRNNGKNKGGGSGDGKTTGGSDEKNKPTTGDCPAGQVTNLNGVCVTVGTTNPGSGSTTEPSTALVSSNPVNIGGSSGDGLSSGAGEDRGAVGRNLSDSGARSGAGLSSGSPSGSGATASSGGSGGAGAQLSSRNLSAPGGSSGGSGVFSDDFGDSKKPDDTKQDGAITDSQFGSGRLYAYVVKNQTKYLSYAKCLKNELCRKQNPKLAERERERIKNLKRRNKLLE